VPQGTITGGGVMFSEFDRLAMTRALALAERGLETTHPNPRVGCVIARGDRIIAEGWHERAGEPHAEVMALRAAKEPVAGAAAYVTLEPCSHQGRTPPCANALIEARLGRVVFAVQDPNPRVSGRGADLLLRAGIVVEAGLMEAEAIELNVGFMKRMKDRLPWVRVKLAMSLDGRTALANGASQWITGEAARADVQRWRARSSAVMTGVGTVLADDPQLNVRLGGDRRRQPLRVVLDSRLRISPGARLLAGTAAGAVGAASAVGAGAAGGTADTATGAAKGASGAVSAGTDALIGGEVLIFTAGSLSAASEAKAEQATATASGPVGTPPVAPVASPAGEPSQAGTPTAVAGAFQARRAALIARGAQIVEVPADQGFLDLFAVLEHLAKLEVNEVLVEAGPTLAGQLLTGFFVDELLLYVAPKLLGPQGRPLVNLPELQSLQDAWGFFLFDAKRFGDDLRLRMRPT
jgi:diaminohydroxyphosphoribosylaminopyrimidine deaminase/5-amino-6-(5-phosphoribosylamino)uracil reductase